MTQSLIEIVAQPKLGGWLDVKNCMNFYINSKVGNLYYIHKISY